MIGRVLPGIILILTLLLPSSHFAQEERPGALLLKVEKDVSGPGGQRTLTYLRVYTDGRVLYAAWWNSPGIITDEKTGQKTRPEKTVSLEYRLETWEVSELASFLQSSGVQKLSKKFGPPHQPIDYFEDTSVQIMGQKGGAKSISTREYYVADLEEKVRYPSALIVLMDKIDEIEKEASEKGKPIEPPADCPLKPQQP